MITAIESAIKYYEEVADRCEYEASRYDTSDYGESAKECRRFAEWLKELKNFKEKDKPKTVRYESDEYMIFDHAFCPNCDHEIEADSENWECEFCPNCGQRLRW